VQELSFVALGDSVTVGLGDRTEYGWRGWAALLAQSLATSYLLTFTNLAREGATSRQVVTEQLPAALARRPQLASVVVGINDAMRSTFDPGVLRADLFTIAERLTASGASLLMVRFHDHGRVFGLPRLLGGPLGRRIEAINTVYDEVHASFGGTYVDLAARPEVYRREAWSVDRLHPSERGHRQLAATFAELLHAAGFGSPPPDLELGGGITPSRWAELAWMVTRGVPWAGRRAGDLGPWAARLALTELQAWLRRRPEPAQPPAPAQRPLLGQPAAVGQPVAPTQLRRSGCAGASADSGEGVRR
jgi:lysophospholipase L1-like esterase